MMELVETFTTAITGTNGRTYSSTRGRFICSRCSTVVVLKPCQAKRQKFCGCGVSNHRTHGLRTHLLYGVWANIKKRCSNPNDNAYKNYGGRGISVCALWLSGFEPFYAWAIANGWQEGLEIDRKNNDGNYEPGNCWFTTPAGQAQNRRVTKLTREQVNEIRARKAAGAVQEHLAHEFNVRPITISRIVRNLIWK